MTLIPFGKPFPGIDSVSLRDGVAAGLVNGFINELKDYEKIPGLTLFGSYPFVEVEPEPPPAEVIFAARRFNGLTDRLDTGLSQTKGSTNNVSMWAWIKKETGSYGTILGAIDTSVNPNAHLQFNVQLGTLPAATDIMIEVETSTPGTSGLRRCTTELGISGINQKIFVAFVNDVPSNRARFFWGFTPDTVIEVPPADFDPGFGSQSTLFSQIANTAVNLNIGAMSTNNSFYENYLGATIDSVGLNFDTVLTLAQLKERAACGLNATTYYWPIDGTDPEPGIVQIVGTTVVAGICGG